MESLPGVGAALAPMMTAIVVDAESDPDNFVQQVCCRAV